MRARILFLPAARLDVIEARDWYAARGVGLGDALTPLERRRLAAVIVKRDVGVKLV